MVRTKELNSKKNMCKRNKGITLLSLVITVTVLLIVAGTTIYTSFARFQLNNLKRMYNDIKLLSNKVANYYVKYNSLPVMREEDNSPMRYNLVDDFDKNVNDNDVYYIIDLSAMEGISLNYGEEGFRNPNGSKDIYIINELSHVIYYVQGIEAEGKIYHTKEDDENIIKDNIPPSKPEIKVISGKLNTSGVYTTEVKIEIIPGKDNWSGVARTVYTINGAPEIELASDNSNSIFPITEEGTSTIHVTTADAMGNTSECTLELTIEGQPEQSEGIWQLGDDGDSVTSGNLTIKVGDYVDYTPEGSETYPAAKLTTDITGNSSNAADIKKDNLKWRVFGVSNGCLTLISDQVTSQDVYLSNAAGYNNGVYVLNDICKKLYSKENLGIYARSLTIEDVEGGLSATGKANRDKYTGSGGIEYGLNNSSSPYTSSKQYPVLYAKEKGSGTTGTIKTDGIGASNSGDKEVQLPITGVGTATATGNLLCTQTYYSLNKSDGNFKSGKFEEILFPSDGKFWLASRFVECVSDNALFGLHRVSSTNLANGNLYRSNGISLGFSHALRPAVDLKPDITVTKGDGTEDNPHKLSKGPWQLDGDGSSVTSGNLTIKIGDYVEYSYDTVSTGYNLTTAKSGNDSDQTINQQSDLKWRVLGVGDNGYLTLISDKPTTQDFCFLGAKGYNNGVYLLNDICKKLYSKESLGIYARSLTIEDVEGGLSDTGIAQRDAYVCVGTQYNTTKAYDTNKQFPILYKEEKGSGIDEKTTDQGIEGSDPHYESDTDLPSTGETGTPESGNLTCTQTHYELSSTPQDYCKDPNFYNMIFGTSGSYWLASRCVACPDFALFCLRFVTGSSLYGGTLFESNGQSYYGSLSALRPTVDLGPDIVLTKGEGTEANPHTISKANP